MSYRVLVVGGGGAFGRRLVEQLIGATSCDVVIAGRSIAKLDAALASLRQKYPRRAIEAAVLDKETVSPDRLRALNIACAVDAAGPFQNAEPMLARAAIAAGCSYIDLADARDFVARFPELDAEAKAAGVAAVTGASSTPALVHAVLDRITAQWQRVDDVAVAISPGNRPHPGPSVIEGILSYAGKPVRVWMNGAWIESPGWGELVRQDMPGLGRRWLSLCETPDLDLLPARFPAARTAIFRAGVELGMFHLALWTLSLFVRVGIVTSLSPLARFCHEMLDAFAAFGSDRGGMTAIVQGLDPRGQPMRVRWSLVADGGEGLNVPVLPALALIRQWSGGRLTPPGATTAAGLVDLDALEREFARFKIRTQTETMPGDDAPVFAQAMGAPFDAMPSLVRHVHSPASKMELEGRVDIDGGETALGRVIARIVGFGPTARDLPAAVTIERTGVVETWTRRFGDTAFSSRMRAQPFDGLTESFGPIAMRLKAEPAPRGFALIVRGWRLGPIPLPRALMPATRASAGMDDQGRYIFDVWIGMPIVGRLIHYRGWLLERRDEHVAGARISA